MKYRRMVMEAEAPEQLGYDLIRNNLSESAISDRRLDALGLDMAALSRLTLYYGDHLGDPALRELIARSSDGAAAGAAIRPDDVLVCTGAAGALFIVATTLLEPGSHLVVLRPNYATNLETPRAIGAELSCIDLRFDDGWRVDLDAIQAALRPDTAFISVTVPHNPTGTVMPWDDLLRLDRIAERAGCRVLVDETYRDLAHGAPYPSAAGISERFIAVSSLSKAYGVPGLRVGWLVTRDQALLQRLLAAKEQIGICGAVIDEHVGAAVLRERESWLRDSTARNLRHLALVREWVAHEPRVDWVEPRGGVVCFPRLRVGPGFDAQVFHRMLLAQHGTYVGPGHWFEMPHAHLRIGYAWPDAAQLAAGLAGISNALRAVDPG